jgi:hypothetical protein
VSLFTFDFEASCLPAYGKSYPIEVGLCEVATGEVEFWIIKPAPQWLDWDWNPAAERLHGLSRDVLNDVGVRAGVVLSRLHGIAANRVVSDSGLDSYWLNTLSQAAGFPPPFEIELVDVVLNQMPIASGPAGQAEVERAQALALERYPKLHHAGEDARRLAEVIRILAGDDLAATLAAF